MPHKTENRNMDLVWIVQIVVWLIFQQQYEALMWFESKIQHQEIWQVPNQ